MKWVPLLNVVLTVLFYALFPVLFPLFLLPKTGPVALKGYVTGFFYLAAWGPLFVILHMMLMYKGAADMSAVTGSNGLSLASFTGMADVNSDIGLLAGYLIASVPFLAGGVAKGAMAISHHATSYLNPSQNAAEEAAREASTGNVSLGNTSFENSSVLTRQFAQGTIAPSFTYGAPQTRTFSDTGAMTTSFRMAATTRSRPPAIPSRRRWARSSRRAFRRWHRRPAPTARPMPMSPRNRRPAPSRSSASSGTSSAAAHPSRARPAPRIPTASRPHSARSIRHRPVCSGNSGYRAERPMTFLRPGSSVVKPAPKRASQTVSLRPTSA
jgi:hypothetical protein